MRKLIVMTAALTAVALGTQGAMGYYAGQISKQQAAKICGGNWDCSDEVCSVAGCESCTNFLESGGGASGGTTTSKTRHKNGTQG